MMHSSSPQPARDRLLNAATDLLVEQSRQTSSYASRVSTRTITARAQVTAPTLYHHFTDLDSLLEQAATQHFFLLLSPNRGTRASEAVSEIARLWDTTVNYAQSFAPMYDLLFGANRGTRSGVNVLRQALHAPLRELATSESLAVSMASAARSIIAANIGVALMLIADPDEQGAEKISSSSFEGILYSVLNERGRAQARSRSHENYVSAAIALNATLQTNSPQQLSEPELALFLQWLGRLTEPENASPSSLTHLSTKEEHVHEH